jgi:uncharacterized membrane protein YfbV (UPF0208 family)
MTWQDRLAIASVWIYGIGVPVVFGFCVRMFFAVSHDIAAIFAAGAVALAWPLSGLIWLGTWLAS